MGRESLYTCKHGDKEQCSESFAGPNGQVEKAAAVPAMCAKEGHNGVTDGQDSAPAAPPARAMAESTNLRILALNMCWPRFPTACVPQRTHRLAPRAVLVQS